MKWQPIKTAPMDGTVIHARRVFECAVIAEGLCYFGVVTIKYGDGPRMLRNVWARHGENKLMPTPTSWHLVSPEMPK